MFGLKHSKVLLDLIQHPSIYLKTYFILGALSLPLKAGLGFPVKECVESTDSGKIVVNSFLVAALYCFQSIELYTALGISVPPGPIET